MMVNTKEIPFTKMHGAGNDYIYVWRPNLGVFADDDLPPLARAVSHRHFGIGADGLVIVSPGGSPEYDFSMRIFNADGSEAQMCGNASRCIGKFLFENSLTRQTDIRLATKAGIRLLTLEVEQGKVVSVMVDMGVPLLNADGIPVKTPAAGKAVTVQVSDKTFDIFPVGMGNPHGVVFLDDKDNLSDYPVNVYGPLLEDHPIWPEKANIEFVKTVGPDEFEMRVWERGSGETLACGTGSCAAAVASVLSGRCGRSVSVNLRGGTLQVEWNEKSGHVMMKGPAQFVAKGTYYFPMDFDTEYNDSDK